MIFITTNDRSKPLFRGYVNKIFQKEYNGGTIKTYKIGTSERKQDGTKAYSSWMCGVMGNARKNEAVLTEGSCIDVYGFKETNISRKNEDGTWAKPYLTMTISDFEIHQFENRDNEAGDEDSPF